MPQPSAGQWEYVRCHSLSPVVASRTQARLSQGESEHWPQQQYSPIQSYLQSSASRFVQGLPGEARLHSDKRFDQSDDRSKDQSLKYINKNDQIPPKHLVYLTGKLNEILRTWCHRAPAKTPASRCMIVIRVEENFHCVGCSCGGWWLEVDGIRLIF